MGNDLNVDSAPNQHVQVDLLTAGADPFGATVISNLYNGEIENPVGNDPPSWMSFFFDITRLAAPGGTYQLRFSEVDNQFVLNMGVDNVVVNAAVPESLRGFFVGLVDERIFFVRFFQENPYPYSTLSGTGESFHDPVGVISLVSVGLEQVKSHDDFVAGRFKGFQEGRKILFVLQEAHLDGLFRSCRRKGIYLRSYDERCAAQGDEEP